MNKQNEKDILDIILGTIEEVNFREVGNIQESHTIALKHYRVCVIDELLKKTKSMGYGLMIDNGCSNVYNGRYWEVLEKDKVTDFLTRVAIKMGVKEVDAKCYKFADELFKQLMVVADVKQRINKRETRINLQNGTFTITKDGQGLREFRAEDYLKYQLDFKFCQSNKCPKFINFLNDVLPDKDAQKGLAEFIASVFVPWLKIEKTVLLYGSGANGKSVIFDIICALIGKDNISTYSLENLTDAKGYQRAEIADKLLNYASEISGNLNSTVFKQLASGEQVEARRIFCPPFIMKDYAKIMFNCNVLPRNTELTDAYFRRFYIIPFEYTIPKEKRDPNLAKKIISEELGGVFNWVLEGLDRLLKQEHLTESTIVQDMLERYRIESDSVALFIEDGNYSKSAESYIPLKKIREEYVHYCKIDGCNACSNTVLSKRLQAMGFTVKRMGAGNQVYIKKENKCR